MNKSTHKWIHRLQILRRITGKYFFKILGSANRWLQPFEKYCIKKGYHHAAKAGSFDDTSNTDEWQKEVYLFAAEFMNRHNYHSITDVGCGSAYKLLHYLDKFETTGIELEATYQWLQKAYPQNSWLPMETLDASHLKTDVVICSDVIEHVPDPDKLVQFIHSIQCRHIIFSTPERDEVAGKNDYGPPENTTHYREWNREEFSRYLSKWFVIEEQHLFKGRSPSQVIVCRK